MLFCLLAFLVSHNGLLFAIGQISISFNAIKFAIDSLLLRLRTVFVLWSELNFSSVLPVGNISHKFDNSIMCCLVAIVCIVSGRIWECYRSDNTSSCINTIQSHWAEIRHWGGTDCTCYHSEGSHLVHMSSVLFRKDWIAQGEPNGDQ